VGGRWVVRVEGIGGREGYLRLWTDQDTGLTLPQIRPLEEATSLTGTESEVRGWCLAAEGLLSLRHPDARLTPLTDPRLSG